jgi:hypothetical protein
MTTISSRAPCVKPSEGPISLGLVYPLETDFVNGGCSQAQINGLTVDDRYTQHDVGATEYDV